MGDFEYNGAHSVDILLPKRVDGKYVYDDSTPINTWEKWRIAPAARPFVASPPIKEEYVDVPGADGMLDYTDALAGKVRYGNRTGSWQFLVENGNFEWTKLQSEILNTLHGKKCRVILTDEPDYYYEGRLTIGTAFGNKDYAGIIVSYNFGPYKHPLGDTSTASWKWKELFLNSIFYGSFSVNGTKARNFVNETGEEINAIVTVSYDMDLFPFDGSEEMEYGMFSKCFEVNKDIYEHTHLNTGNNTIVLQPGDNYMFFVGYGTVRVEYGRGESL